MPALQLRAFFGVLTILAMSASAEVDLSRGSYSNTWVDFGKTGSTAVDVELIRTYDSRTLFDGMFGFGWCSNFESSVIPLAEGGLLFRECAGWNPKEWLLHRSGASEPTIRDTVERIIVAARRAGAQRAGDSQVGALRVELEDDNLMRAEWAARYHLMPATPDGTVFKSESRSGRLWEATFQNGRYELRHSPDYLWRFDRRGRLMLMDSPEQGRLAMTYTNDGLLRRVTRLTAPSIGSGLAFDYYQANGKVSQVRHTSGLVAQYQYGGRDRNDLFFSKDSYRYATSYRYDDLHNLTRIIFTDGSRVDLRYDQTQDLVVQFVDRDRCVEDYRYEIDRNSPRLHFWSSFVKRCSQEVVASKRYEFIYRQSPGGAIELDRVNGTNHVADDRKGVDVPVKRSPTAAAR